MSLPNFVEVDRQPDDESPPRAESNGSGAGHTPFTDGIPDSTPEAPYGYTPTGRIRKRPVGSSSGAAPSRSNEQLAASAAALLTQMNSIVGLSLAAFKMPMTANAIGDANTTFEPMAREALVNDPKLCRKILSGGVSSSKAALTMAYVALGVAIIPPARDEIAARRAATREAYDDDIPSP